MLERIAFLAALAAILTPGAVLHAADDSISGRWKLIYKVENEAKPYDLVLRQEGAKVAGDLISPRTGRKDPLSSGSLEGSALKLEIKRQSGETFSVDAQRKGPSRFEGKLTINGQQVTEVSLTREAPSAIAGKWNAISKGDGGQEYPSTLELTEEGGALKGKTVGGLGTIALDSVKFNEGKLEFQVTLPIDGNNIPFVVLAELKDQNRLVGRWKTRDADFNGEWTATREAAAPPAPPAPVPAPAPQPAAASKDLAGTWHGVVETPEGRKSVAIELAVEGAKLSGKVHTSKGAIEIKDGKASERKVDFSFPYRTNEGDIQIKVEAQLEGGVLKGKWSIPSGESGEIAVRKPVVL